MSGMVRKPSENTRKYRKGEEVGGKREIGESDY